MFLAMFDMPDVAKVFCPKAPKETDDPQAIEAQAQILRIKKAKEAAGKAHGQEHDKKPDGGAAAKQPLPTIPSAKEETLKGEAHLPPIYELIEGGGVLALNMPAGINPALARAVGVMLKNAWLQALLMRPAKMKANPTTYYRPAVFICDEYQAFASVGEDRPIGRRKILCPDPAMPLHPDCRDPIHILIAGRAWISSEAWRALLQTLRTRIFLSLSDDAIRQDCKRTVRAGCQDQGNLHHQRDLPSGRKSPRSQAAPEAAAASMGATKSFREQREAVFHPRDFALLSNCQAICLPYDGAQSLEPRRVYLKPHYLPAEHSYWRAKEDGPNMSAATGLEHLKPFLPGLESALEDSEVSEIMINGPANVWVERAGRLAAYEAPDLDGAALFRAAIHIARPLGLDPASSPIVDARLDDGSRVAICVPPASPQVAITVRRFGEAVLFGG